jgi:hypothetical protein
MVDHYRNRRALGMCGRNGCNAHSGTLSVCPAHREEQRIRSAEYRARDIKYRTRPNRIALNIAGLA